jgi:hypothetical protein
MNYKVDESIIAILDIRMTTLQLHCSRVVYSLEILRISSSRRDSASHVQKWGRRSRESRIAAEFSRIGVGPALWDPCEFAVIHPRRVSILQADLNSRIAHERCAPWLDSVSPLATDTM